MRLHELRPDTCSQVENDDMEQGRWYEPLNDQRELFNSCFLYLSVFVGIIKCGKNDNRKTDENRVLINLTNV